MDLFDYMRENAAQKESPLASRMRPTTLEEVVGQQHIIGQDKLLYRAIKADKLGEFDYFLWTSWNRKDDTRKGYREHNECTIYTDQCDGCREKRYGGGCP